MIKYEDECVGCPTEMGCLRTACPHINVPHYYCDECGEEFDELYIFDGRELCLECVSNNLEKVK